jgi:hypothetical protein
MGTNNTTNIDRYWKKKSPKEFLMHANKIINLIHHLLFKVVVNSPWPLGICTFLLQTYCIPAKYLGKNMEWVDR